MPGERTSLYLTSGLAAAVKASGTPLAELIRRGLVVGTAEAAQPAVSGPAGPRRPWGPATDARVAAPPRSRG